ADDGLEQQLFRVDLSSSFAVNGILPASSVVTSPAPPNSNWKGAGAFFVDDTDTILYSYGGFERDYDPQNSMAMYNTTSESWSTVTVSGGNLNQGDREESMYTSSLGTDLSLSFIQGGYTSLMGPGAQAESASATNLTGMITFNSSDASNLSWTNSTESSNAPDTLGAKMQFVRYGRSGVLVAFGGFNVCSIHKRRNIQMLNILRYTVTASGDIPANRDLFCITMSSAPDGSSSNIVMYGGWTILQNRGWQDIYILSVPSFQWILVDATGQNQNGPEAIGHSDMSCHVYQGRQMIVLGGAWNRGSDEIKDVSCNAAYPSVRALDTTNITWALQWTHTSEPYQVPKAVYKRIGG
ncbi:MAG: hypothetical protein M1830_006229, partial [Pleopsidium flavum]